MVYKKYIKKNGKIYGPYDYQSKRVDGKVISEYVGSKNKTPSLKKIYLFLTAIILVAVLLIYLFFIIKPNTGNIVSNIADNFKKQEIQQESNIDPAKLASQEKIETLKNLGDSVVQQTARNYKDWIIVTFKVGDYVIEYSYSNTLTKDELNSLIEKDKENWLNKISG
jgi:ABC-type dipeptide/oligopeptide/nickel transport system permease component